MTITPLDDIRDRLLQGCDSGYAESLYRQELALLGAEDRGIAKSKTGDIPYFPKLTIRELEVGKSREMLNSIHILTSRLLSSQIGVKITGCHRVTGDVMTQYFRRRLEDGNWLGDIRSCGRDILALGLGVAQVGLEEDYRTGLQKVSVRHHSPWYVLSDLYADNIERATWVCLVHHLNPYDAVDLGFKLHDVETQCFNVSAEEGSTGGKATRPVVRVFEYFDHGTRCLILGSINSSIVKRSENPFGCIPVIFGVGHSSPVLSKPYGRVFSEGAASSFLNQLEMAWKLQLDSSKRMRLFREGRLDINDLEAWHNGESELIRIIDAVEGSPVIDIPAQPVDRNLLEAIQYAKSQYRAASNMSDMDSGRMAQRRVSAAEVDTLQGISNANRSGEVSAITGFVRKLAEKVFEIGKIWDSAPLVVDIMGSEVTLNDPAEPNSKLSLVFDESEYRVLVDAESLTANDDRQKRAMRLAELRELAPLVGQTVPVDVFTRRLLEAMGEDPSEWNLGQQQQAPQQPIPEQGGMPRVEDIARGESRTSMGAEQR